MHVLYLFIIQLATCIDDAFFDYFGIEAKRRYINHQMSLILPVVQMLVACWALGYFFYDLSDEYIVDACAVLLSYPGMRWFIHDNLLSWWRVKSSEYTGTQFGEGRKDALTDRILDLYHQKTGLSRNSLRLICLSISLKSSIIIILINHYLHAA